MSKNFYDRWIDLHAESILKVIQTDAYTGNFRDVAVYVIPSAGATAGRLVVAEELPAGATDVVRFGPHGSRVVRVPYDHLRSLLWNACRSFPVLPTEGPDAA